MMGALLLVGLATKNFSPGQPAAKSQPMHRGCADLGFKAEGPTPWPVTTWRNAAWWPDWFNDLVSLGSAASTDPCAQMLPLAIVTAAARSLRRSTATSSSLPFLLLFALLDPCSAGAPKTHYALYIPDHGCGIFTSWGLCASHGALGAPCAQHKGYTAHQGGHGAAECLITQHQGDTFYHIDDVYYPFYSPPSPPR